MKYRKKPVIVEAIQWDGSNADEILDFGSYNIVATNTEEGTEISIHTLEGIMTASIGDYIIRGVAGECYPCKPDIFNKTYEPVLNIEQ